MPARPRPSNVKAIALRGHGPAEIAHNDIDPVTYRRGKINDAFLAYTEGCEEAWKAYRQISADAWLTYRRRLDGLTATYQQRTQEIMDNR
jgi:hypothetical protein